MEPAKTLTGPAELLAGYLDHYRAAVLEKVDGLSEAELRRSLVPSGWSPLELVKHLAHVELRWLRWGFRAEPVENPWGDHTADRGRWALAPEDTAASVVAYFQEQCERSRVIVAESSLDDVSAEGGRFQPGDERPTLAWILFHVLQEYARHVGHLDIVRELSDARAD
ncbi:DinB family protein [Umezawaea tangerina]|uniref:Uncharacterized protein DUF664 n=1 Tax=Umezawaea tangerina TaxID=84725 RepID=A0A2T0SGD3_9PSEU|nr:DinB family protein [Umezawaea tangerina]PRY32423.1 uncharacterized protein DUF664 [Umezawaea tangerina]